MSASDGARAISIVDVRAASDRIEPWAVRTPTITSDEINDLVGCEVWFKVESQQRTGSFKFRGACNAIAALDDAQRESGVVTWSSGNHGQAIAAAAKLLGSDAVVVMPNDAPSLKVQATASHGARIVTYDRYEQDRVAIGRSIAEREGRLAIPPFDWPDVMAGQGTAALELLTDAPPLDALFVCLGGGGLLAGSSVAAEALSPTTRIYGVEPLSGNDHQLSRRAGTRVDIPVPVTIADGQQTTAPGELTWPINNALVTSFLAVTDDQICQAMAVLNRHLDIVAEPSGASAFAAVINERSVLHAGARVGVTVSGGNVDPARFNELTQPWG